MRNGGLLLLRITVGIVFLYHGWMKLSGIDATTAFFASQSIPLAGFFAYVVGLVEFLGGLAVLLGFFTRVAAKLLMIDMIVALLAVHTHMPWQSAELPLVLLGASAGLLGCGGGGWKIWNKDCSCKMCSPKDSEDGEGCGCGRSCGSGDKTC